MKLAFAGKTDRESREPACPPLTAQGSLCELKRVTAQMTRKERYVFLLLGQGYENREIAALMKVEPNTVKSHIRHITERFEARPSSRRLVVLAALWQQKNS